jgi:hypothetical protein
VGRSNHSPKSQIQNPKSLSSIALAFSRANPCRTMKGVLNGLQHPAGAEPLAG